MSFWGSLFGGQNQTLSSDMSKTGAIGDFSSDQGQKNTSAGSNFYQSLLSGDSSKVAQALAPQISAEKTSLQSDQKKNAITGTRSGGTAASNAAASDKVHSDITSLTGSLSGEAAKTLLSSGDSLLSKGLGAYQQQAGMSQQQMENWSNSILGMGVTSGVGAVESFGLGKV
jgi:hypothetical protein